MNAHAPAPLPLGNHSMPSFSARMMRASFRAASRLPLYVLCAIITHTGGFLALADRAQADTLPPHQIIAEEASDKRRAVSVRIPQRLDEADVVQLAKAIHARAQPPATRSYVNFFLPGFPLGQGAWASVVFTPKPRFLAHGLKRDDEQMLLAEHRADARHLLGSWLTPPPAALGRLTIYSDAGRIFAEWRLKNGQKTVDELKDASTSAGRRFDIAGGGQSSGHYVLLRSGDLEIWAGSTLVAVAERIREDVAPVTARLSPVLPTAQPSKPAATRAGTATIPSSSVASASPVTTASIVPQVASPLQNPRQTAVAANSAINPTALATSPFGAAPRPERTTRTGASSQAAAVRAKSRVRTADIQSAASERSKRSRTLATGDQISAKFAGTL